jgi:ubiquinone/menaquinone biosynthesis C-methylase UbiE
MQKFLSEIPDGSTVLDVPFGTGRFIEFYLKKNMSVYGIDISKDMLDIAREHLGDHYNQCNISVGSAEHLPFENDFFDLVVSCRFLTLIPMAMVKKVLSEFCRVSKSKIILNIRIKKGNTSAKYWKKNKRISGNICEKELINIFNKSNLEVSKKKVITENTDTILLFYILDKKPSNKNNGKDY